MIKPTNENETSRLALIDDLKLFLATAANNWDPSSPPLKRFHLPTGESISCVLWNGLFFVTGTDIVRSLTFRFHAFGRPITNAKKFEEGIFSDLRNLKPGIDARLEEPKSDLLDMLYKNNCIRTQKKQKVFYWYSVPHDRIFLDALERDLKREKMGLEPTTTAIAEPATSTSLDTTQELFDQLRKSMSMSAAATAHALEEEVNNTTCLSLDTNMSQGSPSPTLSSPDQHLQPCPVMMPTSTKTTAFIDPGLSERVQPRRSRVNSVPADFGQDQGYLQQQHLIQKQQKQQRQRYRMSHGSYFAPPSSLATRQHNSSSSTTKSIASDSTSGFNYDDTIGRRPSSSLSFNSDRSQDTLVDGVHQLNIRQRKQQQQPRANHHHHHASHANQQQKQRLNNGVVLPSKSLDSNTLKKTKTIFGALTLFDGSPTYKQRRRRATSVSSSGNQQQQQSHPLYQQQQQSSVGGGPDRIRRHTNCHLRTSSTVSVHGANGNAVQQPTSRLAMAAMAAEFGSRHQSHHQYPQQQRYQGSPMFMHQQTSDSDSSSSLVIPQSWSAMMDTSFGGMDQDGLANSASTSSLLVSSQPTTFVCEYCTKSFQCSTTLDQHRRVHDAMIGIHRDDYMIKDETDDDTDDHYHHHHHHHHRSTSGNNHHLDGSLPSSTTKAGPIHATDSSMYQHYGKNDLLGASTTLLSHPSLNTETTGASTACIEGMLSPVEDMDLEMKDVVLSVDTQPYQQQHYSPYASPGQSDHGLTPIDASFSANDFMLSSYHPEDELSSSSSSSPSSILHYQSYYDMLSHPPGPVLLSPFKPDMPPHQSPNQYHHYHHHHYQQPMTQELNDLFHSTSSSSSTSSYPPLTSFYTPLTTTNDMTTVFN
ncbi:STE like transcription factor-domain-containing protein [Chlamydoabsidia padenii]|nr:STE like transcription factor-domain-containing protein [Chlamydoabsidia padenii]